MIIAELFPGVIEGMGAQGKEVIITKFFCQAGTAKHIPDLFLGARKQQFDTGLAKPFCEVVQHFLAGCIDCHVQFDSESQPVPVNAAGQFCAGCHRYTGVSLDCFQCHSPVPSGPQPTGLVGGAPLVIKLLEGTQGIGVILAETHKAATAVIEAFRGLQANILVQEFIKEAGGADIRCFVVGGKVVAAMKRQGPEGEFRSTVGSPSAGMGGRDRDAAGQAQSMSVLDLEWSMPAHADDRIRDGATSKSHSVTVL